MRSKRGCRVRFAAGCLLAIGLIAVGSATASRAQPSTADGPPNVVVVLTDDQNAADMSVMPNVNRLIGNKGITFENSFVSFPLCCPSRATMLTGQYAHNHHVLHNNPPTGSFLRFDSTNTLPLWLQGAGYFTAHVGKYLNYYEQTPELVPPGYDDWWTSTGCADCAPVDRLQSVYRYYGYRVNENGTPVEFGNDIGDYQTDVYAQHVVDLIHDRAGLDQPFYVAFDPVAPHGGMPQPSPQPPFDCTGRQVALPAARHADAFDDVALPKSPSFNEADVSDKPADIRQRPLLSSADRQSMTVRYQCRLESLLAVDEAVARIVDALRETGELDNTYLIFTSDNGYFFGEHRIPMEKILLYEETIRVPLLMRGPGIEPQTTSRDLVVNADLAPTLVDAAQATPGLTMDGRSLLPITRHPKRQLGREILLESIGEAGIRNHRYAYVEHDDTGERELYDLERDPYELANQIASPAYAAVVDALHARLAELRTCSGSSCERLAELKLRPGTRRRGCAGNGLVLRLAGPDAGGVERLRLRVDGRNLPVLRSAPFVRRIGAGALTSRRVEVRATADLLDGRRWVHSARLRTCH